MRFACSLCIGDVQEGRVLPSSSEWALVNLPKLPPTSTRTFSRSWCFLVEAGVFNICKNVISRKILTLGYSRNGICQLMFNEHSKKTVDTYMRALARTSIKTATDRSSFDVILLIPPQTKGCASYYAFIIPSSPFSFVQLSPSSSYSSVPPCLWAAILQPSNITRRRAKRWNWK